MTNRKVPDFSGSKLEKSYFECIIMRRCSGITAPHARMAKLANATDLKSVGVILAGSSPAPGTILIINNLQIYLVA